MKTSFLSSRISSLRADKLLAAFLVCVFLVMLLFNFLSPLCADDFPYSFSYANGDYSVSYAIKERITNPLMIIPSMIAHWRFTNSRVVCHALVQFFLMLPKAVFNLFNAFNSLLILALIYMYIYTGSASSVSDHPRSAKYPLLIFSAGALIWCCTPDFGDVYLWLDGSCNYSWNVSMVLLYLLPFYIAFLDEDMSISRPMQALFLLYSFVVGTYNEGGSPTAIFLSFLLMLFVFLRRRKLSLFLFLSFVMACLGFLFLVASPAEHERIDLNFYDLLGHLRQIIEIFCLKELLPLFLLYGVSFALSLACGVDRRRVLLSVLIFCGALLSGFVYIFAIYVPGRALCPMTVYLTLSSMILLSELWDLGHVKLISAFSGLLAAFFVLSLMLGAIDIFYLHRCVVKREEIMAQAKADGVTDLVLEQYSTFTKHSNMHGSFNDITSNPNDWRNRSFAAYYGFDSVRTDSDLTE